MKMVERFATLIESTVNAGPASAVAWFLATALAGLALTYRLLSVGYYRCFLSSK